MGNQTAAIRGKNKKNSKSEEAKSQLSNPEKKQSNDHIDPDEVNKVFKAIFKSEMIKPVRVKDIMKKVPIKNIKGPIRREYELDSKDPEQILQNVGELKSEEKIVDNKNHQNENELIQAILPEKVDKVIRAASTRNSTKMKKLLKCSVCIKEVLDEENNFHFTFQCGHSMCTYCIKEGGVEVCKICRRPSLKEEISKSELIEKVGWSGTMENANNQKNYNNVPNTSSNLYTNKSSYDIKIKIHETPLSEKSIIVNYSLLCQFKHTPKCHYSSNLKCLKCKNLENKYMIGCFECNYSFCLKKRCFQELKFFEINCPVGHELNWDNTEIICAKCEEKRRNGLKCKKCLSYNQCVDCSDFQFPIKVCPNDHELFNSTDKSLCSRCPFNSQSFLECHNCNYRICTDCIYTCNNSNGSESVAISHISPFYAVATSTPFCTIKFESLRENRGKIIISENSNIKSLIKLTELLIATYSEDKENSIKIWDISIGTCRKKLSGHNNSILAVTKLSDLKIASSSLDKTLRIWEISTGSCIKIIQIGNNVISLIKMDDDHIISAGGDIPIKIWNTFSGNCVLSLDGHKYSVRCLLKLNSNEIASGSWDNNIKIWNVFNGKCVQTMIGHSYSIICLIKLNEDTIVSGSRDNTIKLWEIHSGICILTLNGHASSIRSLIKLKENEFGSGSNDGSIRIWDVEKAGIVRIVNEHSGFFNSLIKL